MKGFASLRLDGRDILRHVPNDLFHYEASRYFNELVQGFVAGLNMGGDMFFRGNAPLDLVNGKQQANNYESAFTSSAGMALDTTLTPRYRLRATQTSTAPNPPSQTAFPLARLFTTTTTLLSPLSNISSTDIAQQQVGLPYSHAVGRRAFFNESGAGTTATGAGVVTPSGTANFNPSELGSYIYDVRIVKSGNSSGGASYVFRRRPWFMGSYEQGSGNGDAYDSSGVDLPSIRLIHGGTTHRTNINISALVANTASPTPSQVPYNDNYPTPVASGDAYATGMVYDGLVGGRIWWATYDDVASNNVGASNHRALWAWKRMTAECIMRQDTTLTGFPALSTNVMYRDLKAGRGGFLYLAADGSDDSNTGSSNGALIIVNANTNAIHSVSGASVAGIYTVGGLPENNVMGVTVDQSNGAVDRIWVLTRSGLAYADMTYATGSLSSWTNVTSNIQTNSRRGLGGFSFPGPLTRPGVQPALIDHDSAGNAYWISNPSGGGINRLNKIDRTGTTHTYLSLDTVAEGGAAGFLNIGEDLTGPISRTCGSIRIVRKDPGDPLPDDIWLSAGQAINTTVRTIVLLPSNSFSGSNPGMYWGGASLTTTVTACVWYLHTAPDGSAFAFSAANALAILESNSRKAVVGGTGSKTLSAPSGGVQTLTDAAGAFTASMVGHPIFIQNASNAGNNGRWLVSAFTSSTVISIVNAGGASETSAFSYAVDNWDSDPTSAGTGQGTWQFANGQALAAYNLFFDDSGMAIVIFPKNGGVIDIHQLNGYMPICHQWDSGGSRWYRSRFPDTSVAVGRPTHNTAQMLAIPALSNNVNVAFDDGAGGPLIFVAGEYYTWAASVGICKTATQQLTWNYDVYTERTDEIIGELFTNKQATYPGTRVALVSIPTANPLNPYSTNPFTLADSSERAAAQYQRSILLDGTNNTPNLAVTLSSSYAAFAIDLGSAQLVSALRIAFNGGLQAYYATLSLNVWSARQLTTINSVSGTKTITAPDGSNNQILTDPNASFNAADVGRIIQVSGSSNSNNNSPVNGGWLITAIIGPTQIQFLNGSGGVDAGTNSTWVIQPWKVLTSSGAGTAYASGSDCPGWRVEADCFHRVGSTPAFGNTISTVTEIEANLNTLLGGSNPTTERYFRIDGFAPPTSPTVGTAGMVAFDAFGFVIGAPSGKRVATADDSNFLAAMPSRFTWLEDSGAGTASRDGVIQNRVTLTGDAFLLPANGVGDAISAPSGPTQTLTDAASLFTAAMIGRYVVILGASNALNNGAFLITGVPASNQLQYTNPTGVAQAGFTGTWAVDGVTANDFFRTILNGTGVSFSSPTLGIQTITIVSAAFDPSDQGRFIVTTGATNPTNNNGFRIFRVLSTTQIMVLNPTGVSESGSFSWKFMREATISSVDSSTQLTLASNVLAFTNANWEVVRNADVRPRDDEGGGENQARLPVAGGEVFFAPVTGHLWYADVDAQAGRTLRTERYLKVKRST